MKFRYTFVLNTTQKHKFEVLGKKLNVCGIVFKCTAIKTFICPWDELCNIPNTLHYEKVYTFYSGRDIEKYLAANNLGFTLHDFCINEVDSYDLDLFLDLLSDSLRTEKMDDAIEAKALEVYMDKAYDEPLPPNDGS
jgi:hypothetical protein